MNPYLQSLLQCAFLLMLTDLVFSRGRSVETQGPRFVREPPSEVDFSNTTGKAINCVAKGVPSPSLEWLRPDGSKVVDAVGLRLLLPNGTLYFPPFRAEDYRQDIHASVYACVATNAFGTIVSRDVRVRAVVQQYYEAQVYDEFVIRDNTAALRCIIPSFVHDYVIVTSWIRESASGVQAVVESGGRFSVFPSGILHIRDVTNSDGSRNYRCRTQHRLTGDIRLSTTAGRLIITDPQSSVPPRMTHYVGTVEVEQGKNLELPCAAQGYPTPFYSWMKVKKSIFYPVQLGDRIQQNGGNLLIKSVQSELDSGTYVCVVNNSVGIERVETTVFVTAPLTAQLQPEVQVVDVDKVATFNCVVSGHPITSVAWLKDGRPLAAGDRIKIVSRDVLRIEGVQREDRGMYQCLVKNTQTSAQGTAELKLGDAAPLLQDSFPGQVLDPGKPAFLRCVISGNPPPQVTWTLDGLPLAKSDNLLVVDYVNIHGDVISHVNISRLRTEDGGEYKCVGKNKVGKAEHWARINVTGPPYIRPMPNVSVVAGSTAVLLCRISGYPIEIVYWERGGTVLPINHRQKVYPNGTLAIHNVERAADAGPYICVAQSATGESARRTVQLAVMNAPMISPFNFPSNLREGMRAGVTCLITEGDQPITIKWLKDGKPIPAQLDINTRNMDEYTSTMVIASISPRHNGNYTCVAENEAASVQYTARLLVNVPPRWVVEPKEMRVIQKHNVRVECQADGFPPPAVTWKKATGKISGEYREIPMGNSARSTAKNGSLILRNVEESDEGYYLCQATNGIGAELSKVIFLDIQVPAYFGVSPRNQTVKKGDTTRLHCEAKGDAPLTVFWKLKDRRLDSSSDSRLLVKNTENANSLRSELLIAQTERKDYATYVCFASNAYGSDETSIQLIVQEPPEPPGRIAVKDTSSRSARLTWTVPHDGHSRITRYIVQYKTGEDSWYERMANVSVSGGFTSATLTGLSPATRYEIRVFAENGVGTSNASVVSSFTTAEEEPNKPPTNVQVEPASSQSLRVKWKPPPKDSWNGQLEGYHVGFREEVMGIPLQYQIQVVRVGATDHILTGLKKYTRYGVVVSAYNRKGAGPQSQEVVMSTLEDVPSQPPQDLRCTPKSSTSVVLSWKSPPPAAIHGLLQGYRVLYAIIDRPEEEKDSRSTKSVGLELGGLERFTNYTFRVTGFTRAGDGVPSERVYCRTEEDVPGPPAEMKALVMSSDAILVSWLPPRLPNGIIIKYSIYMREVGHQNQGIVDYPLLPNQLYFEARGLKENFHYEFWVTASTVVGEGEKSRIVSQSPVSTVPAKIASFPERSAVPRKSDVKLHCRAVGIPTPDREWRVKGQKIQDGPRSEITPDGSLLLRSVKPTDSGNYTCRANNIYNTDELTHELIVQADHEKEGPPAPPVVSVAFVTMFSISLAWKVDEDGGGNIQGFNIHIRPNKENNIGKDISVDGTSTNYTLEGLNCGTKYEIYMTATNQFGSSGLSEIIETSTKGFAPLIPEKESFLVANATYLTLNLEAWNNNDAGACSVQHLMVEYRPRSRREWTLVVRELRPDQHYYIVGDLAPGSPYTFRVTAYSDAGPTVAHFDVITLSHLGSAGDMTSRNSSKSLRFYLDLNIIIPIIVSVIMIAVVIATICYFLRRRRYTGYKHGSYPLQEKIPRDNTEKPEFDKTVTTDGVGGGPQTYSPSPTRRSDANQTETTSYTKQGGVQDEICPYATYQLPECVTDEDATVHFQTFGHTGRPGGSSQQSGTPGTKVVYSKVRKFRQTPMLELQRTQNQGISYETRAPYEEKKTFSPTTHDLPTPTRELLQSYVESPLVPTAPPAEYDSTMPNSVAPNPGGGGGSGSPLRIDQNLRSKPMHRVPDLLYHRQDSSTSNEASPDTDRGSSSRGNSRCSSPESTTEEMNYTFPRNLGPPTAFSDRQNLPDKEEDRNISRRNNPGLLLHTDVYLHKYW